MVTSGLDDFCLDGEAVQIEDHSDDEDERYLRNIESHFLLFFIKLFLKNFYNLKITTTQLLLSFKFQLINRWSWPPAQSQHQADLHRVHLHGAEPTSGWPVLWWPDHFRWNHDKAGEVKTAIFGARQRHLLIFWRSSFPSVQWTFKFFSWKRGVSTFREGVSTDQSITSQKCQLKVQSNHNQKSMLRTYSIKRYGSINYRAN